MISFKSYRTLIVILCIYLRAVTSKQPHHHSEEIHQDKLSLNEEFKHGGANNSRRLQSSSWDNVLMTKPRTMKWPTLKLHGYNGNVTSFENIFVVYDIVSNNHYTNVDLYLSDLTQARSSAAYGTTIFTYLFLLPDNISQRMKIRIGSFCQQGQTCILHTTSRPSNHDPSISTDPSLAASSMFFSWEELFTLFMYVKPHIEAVFIVRSHLLGPIYPHYAPMDFNIYTAYTQYLTPQTPIVLSNVNINNKKRRASLSLLNTQFPIMMTGEFARVMAIQPFVGRKWLMAALSSGLNLHILDPSYTHIDWLKYYECCWLKAFTLAQCKQVDSYVQHVYRGEAYRQGNVPYHFPSHIQSPLYNPYLSLFEDTTKTTNDQANYLIAMIRDRLSANSSAQPMLPLLAANQLESKQQNDGRIEKSLQSKKTLVVYVYFEANAGAIDNFIFFVEHALVPTNLIDFIIIVNGAHTVRMPKQFNVQVIYKENSCFDIGSWAQVIQHVYKESQGRKKKFMEDPDVFSHRMHMDEEDSVYRNYLFGVYKYKYYIVLNSSVRGPYLPPVWNFGDHLWTEGFTSHITDDGYDDLLQLKQLETGKGMGAKAGKGGVKLVGLSINCPDGVGRKHLHMMSMILAFDNIVLDIWMNSAHHSDSGQSVLHCAASKEDSFRQESDLTMHILQAGYSIHSLQHYYHRIYWQGLYKSIMNDKSKIITHNHLLSCSNILLDVFYQPKWDMNQTTPHPYDYIFIKTNRDIYGKEIDKLSVLLTDYKRFPIPIEPRLYDPAYVGDGGSSAVSVSGASSGASGRAEIHQVHNVIEIADININPNNEYIDEENKLYHVHTGYRKQCILFTHNLQYEGAPMWLLRISTLLQKQGYLCKVFSLIPGPLGKEFEAHGIEVIQTNISAPYVKGEPYSIFGKWQDYLSRQLKMYYDFSPNLYVFNTVLFVKTMYTLPVFANDYRRYIWAIHEAELFDAIKGANKYAYAHDFKELLSINGAYLGPHKILFVSDSGREYASKFDFGQMVTIRGFVEDNKCNIINGTARVYIDIQAMRQQTRQALNIPQDAYVISAIGTICRRKQQHWLIDLMHQSNVKRIHQQPLYVLLVGYDGKSEYETELQKYVIAANLTSYVFLIKHNSNPLAYAAAADLHVSLSTHESFPLNTLEVMCLGIPILATPAFGIREQILFPGKTGVLLAGTKDYNGFQNSIKDYFDVNNPALIGAVQPADGKGARAANAAQLAAKDELHAKWQKMGGHGMRAVQKYFTTSAITPYYDELAKSIAPNKAYIANKVCVVMRFHGKQIKVPRQDHKQQIANRHFNLEEAIRSIYFQMHTNWELLLVPSDTSDITPVYSLLVRYNHYFDLEVAKTKNNQPKYVRSQNFNKIRMVSFHEHLRAYDAKDHASFHQHLYNLTDMAIQQCSPDSNWLLVTNGDNFYHQRFFNHLDNSYDIMAYDFYSRWYKHQETKAPPCERLMIAQSPDAKYQYNPSIAHNRNSQEVLNSLACKRNGLARNHTDLGANIVNLRKWLNEGHRYGNIISQDASHDGTMMELLLRNQWSYKRILQQDTDLQVCLFNHNPNYHSCISRNSDMIWDDSKHICYEKQDLQILNIKYKNSKLHRCITT